MSSSELTRRLPNMSKAAKRALSRLEGTDDASNISPISRFLAGGIGGVVSQYASAISILKYQL